MSDQNEPDLEAAEIGKKTKSKKYTSNPRLTHQHNIEKISGAMPVAGLYFGNNKPSDKIISKTTKSKVLTSGLNTKKKSRFCS